MRSLYAPQAAAAEAPQRCHAMPRHAMLML